MKLSLISEDKLPHELKTLANNYWNIRDTVVSQCRSVEPYICIQISLEIKNHLENNGHTVKFVKDSDERHHHFHLEVDEQYVVDGSDYQFDYNKPIGQHLPPRITQILTKNNITTIGSAIALIDYLQGHELDWTDAGCGWDPNANPKDHQQALQELRPPDIKTIKGRLLPIMLKIQPTQKWGRDYMEVDPELEPG